MIHALFNCDARRGTRTHTCANSHGVPRRATTTPSIANVVKQLSLLFLLFFFFQALRDNGSDHGLFATQCDTCKLLHVAVQLCIYFSSLFFFYPTSRNVCCTVVFVSLYVLQSEHDGSFVEIERLGLTEKGLRKRKKKSARRNICRPATTIHLFKHIPPSEKEKKKERKSEVRLL